MSNSYFIGASGSDSANGLTWATRWLTYAHAGTTMAAGDVLYTAAPTGNTLAVLRGLLGEPAFCGDVITGIADTNTDATKLIDSAMGNYATNTFNYGWLAVTSGAATGQRRQITAFTTSTGAFTVDYAFGAAPTAAATYEIHRKWSPDDKDKAINAAIRRAGRYWWKINEDESLTFVSTTYAYSLASLAVPVDPQWGLLHVDYEVDTDQWARINPNLWSLRNDNGTLYLDFDSLTMPGDDESIRLTYRVRPPVLASDAETLSPDVQSFANFVCTKATAILFQKKANDSEQDARQHWQMLANQMNQEAHVLLTAEQQGYPNQQLTASEWL